MIDLALFYRSNLELNNLDVGPLALYSKHRRSTPVTQEVTYRGFTIQKRKYDGPGDGLDSLGFPIEHVYCVVDDFGDHALPFSQQFFWSPADAAGAVDFWLWAKDRFPKRFQLTSPLHEYNQSHLYRRRPGAVYAAIDDIKKLIREAADFEENPAAAISQRIYGMEVELREWPKEPVTTTLGPGRS